MKNVCDITLAKMTTTLQKTYEKVQKIFHKLTNNVKENDFMK